jgi:tellurite resistance protein TerC
MDVGTVGSPWLWAGFVAFVVAMLALDLGVFHRRDHAVGTREALSWSLVWIGLALLFGAGVWWHFGPKLGMEYLTGWIVEKSLSVDNLFVFVVLFRTLAIPPAFQHRVLFWGVLSALVLRAVMIVGGTALLARFGWFMYVFGAFLLITGVKLLFSKEHVPDPEKSAAFRWFRRVLPVTPRFHGHAFFAREAGRLVVTPLFLALAFIEVTDVIFAVDSIPAVFAVTRDPFIVFTSNIFAILGLRSLYFLLANIVERFTYQKPALSAVLVYVGVKMLVAGVVHVPPAVSLAIIGAILGTAIVASVVKVRREDERAAARERVSPEKAAAARSGT